MSLVEHLKPRELTGNRAKLTFKELEAQEILRQSFKSPKHSSNCMWYKIVKEGVSFISRTPKDLKCFTCEEEKRYLNCDTYQELYNT